MRVCTLYQLFSYLFMKVTFSEVAVITLLHLQYSIPMRLSSYQQLAQLHEVEHVALVHLGQLFAQLNGLFPHLRRHVHHSVTRATTVNITQGLFRHLVPTAVLGKSPTSRLRGITYFMRQPPRDLNTISRVLWLVCELLQLPEKFANINSLGTHLLEWFQHYAQTTARMQSS